MRQGEYLPRRARAGPVGPPASRHCKALPRTQVMTTGSSSCYPPAPCYLRRAMLSCGWSLPLIAWSVVAGAACHGSKMNQTSRADAGTPDDRATRIERLHVSQILQGGAGTQRENTRSSTAILRLVPTADGLEIYWSLNRGCAVSPEPRIQVDRTTIRIDPNLRYTGHVCSPTLTTFLARVPNLRPGQYQVVLGTQSMPFTMPAH